MPEPAPGSLLTALRSAQSWWQSAGVDCDFVDAPQNWLAVPEIDRAPKDSKPKKPVIPDEATPVAVMGGECADWPTTLADFDRWWMEESSLSMGSNAPRPAPYGPSDAPLMVLVPEPEAQDRDTLLSGSHGELVANILRAMAIGAQEVRVAAVLPRHTPGADWAAFAAAGIGPLTLHHIALANPKRLLVLGRTILPLLGADPEQAAALKSIQAGDRAIETFAGREPATLLVMAPARRALWNRWLERSIDD